MRAVVLDMPPHWLKERKVSGADQWDEVWHGVLHVPPMANRVHMDLELQLAAYLITNWGTPNGCRVHHEVNLTTPWDESNWINNYRIPDIVLLTPPRFHIDKIEYMAGGPDVVVEIRSPGDESYEKLEFYAQLGVLEAWIIDRDTKIPEIYQLRPDGAYGEQAVDADGWMCSKLTGVQMKPGQPGKLAIRMNGDPATLAEIPK